MILGRNAGLWAALIQAGLNLVMGALVVVTGHALTADETALFGAANVFGLAIVGLIANASDQVSLPTFAPTLHDRRTTTPPAGSAAVAQPMVGGNRKDDPPQPSNGSGS